jgi:DNA-binding transcriptional LysR family regulator
MNTNKFSELNTFVVVVDSKGIGEAARRFGISKSVVSERIKSLEKRLKISLLERGNKLPRLSPRVPKC